MQSPAVMWSFWDIINIARFTYQRLQPTIKMHWY